MSTSTLRFIQQENSRLKEENEALREENLALRGYMTALEALYLATQEIISEENLFDLLDKILYSAMAVLKAEDGSLLLRDEDTGEMAFVLVHGDIRQELRGYRLSGDVGIVGWVASNQQPLIVNNPGQDRRFFGLIDEAFDFTTRSIICVPIVFQDKFLGVIELLNKSNEEAFIDTDITLLSILAQTAAAALEDMHTRLESEET